MIGRQASKESLSCNFGDAIRAEFGLPAGELIVRAPHESLSAGTDPKIVVPTKFGQVLGDTKGKLAGLLPSEKCCIQVKQNGIFVPAATEVKANTLVFMMGLARVGVNTNEWFHLYLRPSAYEELVFLDTHQSPFIRGPPGTSGKSVVAWFFALQAVKRGGKSAVVPLCGKHFHSMLNHLLGSETTRN